MKSFLSWLSWDINNLLSVGDYVSVWCCVKLGQTGCGVLLGTKKAQNRITTASHQVMEHTCCSPAILQMLVTNKMPASRAMRETVFCIHSRLWSVQGGDWPVLTPTALLNHHQVGWRPHPARIVSINQHYHCHFNPSVWKIIENFPKIISCPILFDEQKTFTQDDI